MKPTHQHTVVVGLGLTGLSCVRYLTKQNISVAVTDSRENPPGLIELQQEFPGIEVICGEFSQKLITNAQELVLSPGVSLKQPFIAARVAQGIPVLGDIELFAKAVNKPVLAITGSNGKTTVTTLMGQMVEASGHAVEVCGNIGQPVLDVLQNNWQNNHAPDFYVMELSSFQLETTYSLKTKTATVLNISPDHMDRYNDYSEYVAAKQKIYQNCERAIINADEPEIWQNLPAINRFSAFTLNEPSSQWDFGIRKENNDYYLAQGEKLLLPVSSLKLKGQHHWQNALACLALGTAINLPMDVMLSVLQDFSGLPHRCQWVSHKRNIDWYNDSKGTNVGATLAAITSMGLENKGKMILIAGGDSKKADLTALQQPIAKYVSHVILLGKDALLFEQLLKDIVPTTFVKSIPEAVNTAANIAQANDIVLLSPACASLDMFKNYEQRGEVFIQAIAGLTD